MEKIRFDDLMDQQPLLEWFLVHCAVQQNKINDIVEAMPESKEYSISLVVNGIEVPLLEGFQELQKQMDRMVKEKAQELLKETLYDFDDFIHELQDQIIEQISTKLGIHFEKDYS